MVVGLIWVMIGGGGFILGGWWRGVRFILGGGGLFWVAVGGGRLILGDGRWWHGL